MALSKDQIKSNYPLPTYNYRVEIDSKTMGFSEVAGLSISRETVTYKESPASKAPGPIVMHMPAQVSPPSITLKKGMIKSADIRFLFDWINSVQLNQVQKKDVTVRLCDEKGDAVISWRVLNAFPKKLDAPSFSASSNDAAIESIELMADMITVDVT